MGFWQKTKTTHEGQAVVTAELMGSALAPAALQSAQDLFADFQQKGVTAPLSVPQQFRLLIELLAFDLVCRGIAMVRTYGEKGHEVGRCLARATLAAFADEIGKRDAADFVAAGLHVVQSHTRHYGRDIWAVVEATTKEEFEASTLPLGQKIVRKILHPVVGLAPPEPAGEPGAGAAVPEVPAGGGEGSDGWEHVADGDGFLLLATTCCIHAILGSAPQEKLAQQYPLGAGQEQGSR